METEYDLLLKHNVDLLGKKAKLEGQISRMRQLLDHLIQVSKRQQEQEQRRVATEFLRSKSLCETAVSGVSVGVGVVLTSSVVVLLVAVVASNRVHCSGLVLGLEVGLTVGPLPVIRLL